MERPMNLQRLCAISLSSKSWEVFYVTLQIRELFPPKLQELQPAELKNRPKQDRLGQRQVQVASDSDAEYLYPTFSCIHESILLPLPQHNKPQHYLPQRDFPINSERYKNFQKTALLALNYLNLEIKDKLPSWLQTYCQDILMEMGNKLYFWLEFLDENIKCSINIPEKIYWTPTGAIDEGKMLKMLETDEEFLKNQSTIHKPPLLQMLACLYAQEDYIENHQDEMEAFLKDLLPNFKLENYENKVYTLMALYLHFMIKRYIKSNELNDYNYVISPETMFDMSVHTCLHKPVYYFWGILKDFGYGEEKLLTVVQACLSKLIRTDGYCDEKLAEILVFLINQISSNRRREFIQSNAQLLFRGLLPYWPFNEVIPEITSAFFSELTLADYRNIFTHIDRFIPNSKKLSHAHKIEYYREVFKKVLKSLSEELREGVFDHDFMDRISSYFDPRCLSFILSKLDSEERKIRLRAMESSVLKKVQEKDLEWLQGFLDDVLFKEEIEEYKSLILKEVDKFLMEGKLDKANKLFEF